MSSPEIDHILEQAAGLQKNKKWQESFNLLVRACAVDWNNPQIIKMAGLALLRMGQAAASLPYYQHLVELTPGSPSAHTDLGVNLAMLAFPDLSENEFQKALEFDPAFVPALKMLVVVYAQQAHHTQARNTLEKLVEIAPKDAEALLLQAQYREFDQDYEGARQTLQTLLKRHANHLRAQNILARLSLPSAHPAEPTALNSPIDPKSITMLVPDSRIDRRVLDEARSLIQAGWKVTVIAGTQMVGNPWWDEESYSDVPIVRVDHRRRLSVTCLEESAEYVARLTRERIDPNRIEKVARTCLPAQIRASFIQTDEFFMEALEHPARIYTAHDLPMVTPALMAAGFYGSYLVYDSHELYPALIKEEAQQRQVYEMDRYFCGAADQVITVNQSLAEEFKKRYDVLPQVILNCPAYAPEQIPVPKTDILRRDLNILKSKKILLYQGNMAYGVRNLENVIAAMKILKRDDIVFVLMGHDYGQRAPLEDVARQLGVLGTRVLFHDSVRQDQLLRYTASADAGIIPYPPMELNSYYCTPNKMFEFIVAGLPILANDLPELRRFVSGQGIGINQKMTNAQDIALAIDSFFAADLSIFREKLKSVSQQFVWQVEGEKIVRIYSNLENKAARAAARL